MTAFLKDKKYQPLWMLLAIILLQIGFMFFLLGKREGVHVDEMYSLESAHYLRTGVTRLTEQDTWYEKWHTTDDFNQYFTVSGEESFWAASFRDKVYMLAKISLYKILLNIVLSATPGEYSLTAPFLLNLVFFVLTQLLLYWIGDFVFGNKRSALLIPLFFGFSAGAVNMVLYIRMYAMIMFFSALMVWLYLFLLQEERVSVRTVLLYTGIFAVSYYSYLCHQYTVLLVAALCAAYCIMQFLHKKWKWAIFHIVFLSTAASAYVIKSGKWRAFLYGAEESRYKEAMEILQGRTCVEWLELLGDYGKTYLRNAWGGVFIFLFILIAILMAISYRKGKEGRLWTPWTEREKTVLIFTVLTSFLFYIALSRIAPSCEPRYISYLFPIGALIIAIWVNHILGEAPRKYFRGSAILVVLLMALINTKGGYIEYLYEEIAPIMDMLQEETYQIDTIYVNSDKDRHQIYRDGYLWQEGLRYYVTTPEMLREHIAPGIEECSGNAVMLWVKDGEDTYEILKDLYVLAGFDTHDKLGYTQESKVYYLTRE